MTTREYGANLRIVSKRHQGNTKSSRRRGFNGIGEFSCEAFDTAWSLKLIGRMNKGGPNARDLETATSFAKGVKVNGVALPTRS